jgi:hypothetical protein
MVLYVGSLATGQFSSFIIYSLNSFNMGSFSPFKLLLPSQVPVAHVYNPSYSGGQDQEDRDLKPALANSSHDLISKKTIAKKKGWWSGST